LIVDVVQFAKGKRTIPPELQAAWWCRDYHALPGLGSVYQQDYHAMIVNDALPNIYDAIYNWRHNSRALSDGDRKTIVWLVKIGAM
jgi:hypothetical protein